MNCDEQRLLGGANLLRVGGEFVQFATATLIGSATYRLTNLLRGRFDSDVELAHPSGTDVYLLDPGQMVTFREPRDRIGSTIVVRVHGPDGTGAEAALTLTGQGNRPWKPAHIRAADVIGGLQLSWIRCCKEGGPWLDGVESPFGASREAYSVRISDQSGGNIYFEAAEPAAHIESQTLSGLGPRPWRLEIRQLGDFAAGRPQFHLIK